MELDQVKNNRELLNAIDWDMTPEEAVRLYLEWGNNWARGNYVVRSKDDVSHYFVVNTWGENPIIYLIRRNSDEAVELALGADVVVSESAFASSLQEKAEMRKHMSAKDAAFMAEQAGAKELILTHFSQRYKTVEELEEEAKIHFENVRAAFDFMKIKL